MARAIKAVPDACGIDFGTSNSTAGCVGAATGQVALLPLEDDKLTLPSVVFFHAEDAHVSYGRAALADYLAGDEGRLMRSMKSCSAPRSSTNRPKLLAGRCLSARC